jgi:diaminohydroxyphosphoribosylaminopyrimidine deaminase/5-amino-6-(5-phosphoribosylamino)uracil reductase
MAVALQLGQRGLGQVWPNPAVGCVIVKNNRVVGRGRTMVGGRPHAEAEALAQAGTLANGATVYVTLEPCAHQGKTPPCAQALIDAKVARVVIATGDPDPRVDGGGIAMLRAAGISVTTDVLRDAANSAHAGFFQRIKHQRPFLTLKVAITLDGRIATKTGESQWITGPAARLVVHGMRAKHDAVMVGAGTVRADDPQLTVRGFGARRQPVRVVVSRDLNLPVTAQMFQTTQDAPVWVCHGPADASQFQALGVESLACNVNEGRVDLESVLNALAEQGLTRVFCEGGGALAASLLAEGLVNRLEVFQAGKVIGGDGVAAVAAMGVARLSDAPNFQLVATRRIGGDVLTSWDRV